MGVLNTLSRESSNKIYPGDLPDEALSFLCGHACEVADVAGAKLRMFQS